MRIILAAAETVEYRGFWANFADLIWWFLTFFILLAYLFVLWAIIADLFRDHKLKGWAKAIWIVFLIFFPVITAIVYLIARGSGMGKRAAEAQKAYQTATDDYIKGVAGTSAADEIAKAKQLLDAGTITPDEYEHLKKKALGGH